MSTSTLALFAILPSLLLMRCFYVRERYTRPPRAMWATFVLGMTIFVPILLIAPPLRAWIEGVESPMRQQLAHSFGLAAFPEELFKWLVLLGFSSRVGRIRGPLDGVLYGVAVSLGFATVENVLYVAVGGPTTAFLRAFTAIPCHALLGVLMGYAVGRAAASRQQAVGADRRGDGSWASAWWWGVALFLPVAVHTAYDFPLFALGAIFDGSVILRGDSLVPISLLTGGYLVNLLGGLLLAILLAGRAREARDPVSCVAAGSRRTDSSDGRQPMAQVVRAKAFASRRSDREDGRSVRNSRTQRALGRLLLGIGVAGFGGWLLFGLVAFLASPEAADSDLVAASIIVLLLAGGAVAYGLHLASAGWRMTGPRAARGGEYLA